MTLPRYRIAQWATGNVGLHALRSIIAHPLFELVALRVYSEKKIGRDAGEIAGLAPTGVIATVDIEDVIAARPDCVVYMPDRPEIDVLVRLLGEGINVATSLTDFNHRESIDRATCERLEAASRAGNASLYASGSTPGYSTETVLFGLTSIMRRLDSITQTESADISSRDSREMLFNLLGFGSEPDAMGESAIDPTTGLAPSLRMTAAALGLPLDAVTCTHEYALATADFDIAAGHIRRGTVAAMRMEICGMRGGTALIRRRAIWYLTRELHPAWDIPGAGWHYRIEGDVPIEVSITQPLSREDYSKASPGFTANPVINAIPYICAARPGLLQTDDLPPVIGYFGG